MQRKLRLLGLLGVVCLSCRVYGPNTIGLENNTVKKTADEPSVEDLYGAFGAEDTEEPKDTAQEYTKIIIPKDAPGNHVFYDSFYKFLSEHVLEPYKKLNPTQDALAYLDNALKYISEQKGLLNKHKLFEQGEALIKNGNMDPFIAFAHACVLRELSKYKEMETVLEKCSDALKADKNVNKTFKYLYFALLVKSLENQGQYKDVLKDYAFQCFKEAILNGEIKSEDDRILSYLDGVFLWGPDRYLKILNLKPESFKWFKNMTLGDKEIDAAWEARGCGWANTVSKRGWKGFHEHLVDAYNYFKAAWEQYPDRPEVPAKLITVAMGGGTPNGESQIYWFNQSVKAEIEYYDAYKRILWGLRPRWCGSYKKMYSVGKAALDTERYDTKTPEYYIYALVAISDDMHGYKKEYYFRKKKIKDNLKKMFDGLLKNYAKKEDKIQQLKAARVVAEYLSGQYKEAKKHLQEVPVDYNFKRAFAEYDYGIYWKYSRKQIEKELDACLLAPEKINEAYKYFYAKDKSRAIKILKDVLNSIDKDNKAAREVILEKIACFMINPDTDKTSVPNPALCIVAKAGDKAAIEEFLKMGADIHLKDGDGAYPFTYVVRKINDLNVIKKLYDKNIDLNAKGDYSWTVLHQAARHSSNPEVIKFLIEHGADINALTDDNHKPLHLVAFNDSLPVLEYLLSVYKDVDTPGYKNRSLLCAIASDNDDKVEMVKKVVEKGANINYQDKYGDTPLILAEKNDNKKIVDYLLKKGADKTIKNNNNESYETLNETSH